MVKWLHFFLMSILLSVVSLTAQPLSEEHTLDAASVEKNTCANVLSKPPFEALTGEELHQLDGIELGKKLYNIPCSIEDVDSYFKLRGWKADTEGPVDPNSKSQTAGSTYYKRFCLPMPLLLRWIPFCRTKANVYFGESGIVHIGMYTPK